MALEDQGHRDKAEALPDRVIQLGRALAAPAPDRNICRGTEQVMGTPLPVAPPEEENRIDNRHRPVFLSGFVVVELMKRLHIYYPLPKKTEKKAELTVPLNTNTHPHSHTHTCTFTPLLFGTHSVSLTLHILKHCGHIRETLTRTHLLLRERVVKERKNEGTS